MYIFQGISKSWSSMIELAIQVKKITLALSYTNELNSTQIVGKMWLEFFFPNQICSRALQYKLSIRKCWLIFMDMIGFIHDALTWSRCPDHREFQVFFVSKALENLIFLLRLSLPCEIPWISLSLMKILFTFVCVVNFIQSVISKQRKYPSCAENW